MTDDAQVERIRAAQERLLAAESHTRKAAREMVAAFTQASLIASYGVEDQEACDCALSDWAGAVNNLTLALVLMASAHPMAAKALGPEMAASGGSKTDPDP
jgi:hypothetical protein